MVRANLATWLLLLLAACGSATGRDGGSVSASAETSVGGISGGTSAGSTTGASGEDSAEATTSGDSLKFDTPPPGSGDSGGASDLCKVSGELSGVGSCEDSAPPDAFAPAIQWAWPGDGPLNEVIETPLVINFTDDNGDGAIDLCDIPDVIVA